MSQPMIDSEEMVYLGPEKGCQPRSKISVEDIAVMKVTCTACGNQINHYNASEIKCHIHLRVLMCKKCFKYYGAGIFQKDETGVDEYCRWCGDGGNLILCDFCENAFCKECINRNFGPSELSKATVAASWQCYVCNSEPLSGLVSFCSMVKEYAQQQKDDVKDKSEKKSDFQSKNIFKKIELIFTRLLNEQTLITGSESWLEDNFAQGLLSLTMTMEDLLKVRKKYERKASEPTAVDDGVRRIQDVLKIHIHNVEMVLNNIQASYLAHKNHLAHQSEILSGKSFLFLTENIASDSKSEMDLQNEGFDKTKNIKDKTAVFKEGLTDQLNPQCGSGDSFKEPLCEDNYEVSIENEAKCKNIEKLLDTCYENVQLIKKPQVLAEDIATGINESLSDNLHYSELDNKNGEEGDEATHELHLQCENPESVRKPVNKEGEESSSTTEINRALLDLQYKNTELVGESIKKERETRSTDVETTSINNEVAPTQELQCENQKLVSEPVTKKREENSAESENSKINKEFSETLELFDEDIEEPLVKCEEKKLPEILKSQCKTAESFAEQPSEVGQKYPTKGEATKHVLHTPELQGEIVESKVEQQNTNHTEELKEIESIDNNKILVEMHEVGYENVKSTKEQGKKDRDNMIRAEGIKIKDISDKSTFFSKSTALVMESPNEGGKEDFEDVKSGVSSGTEQSSVKMYIKCNEEKEMKNKKAQCVKTKITLHGRSLETSEEKTESEVSQHKIGIDELNKESTDNEKTRDLLLKDLNVKPSSDDFDFADVKSHQCNVFTDGIKTCRGDHNSNSNDDFTDHDTVNNKINDNQEIISHYTDNSSVKDDNTDNLSIKESLCGYNKLSSNPQVILQRLPENIVDVPCMEKVCKAFIQKRGRHSSESSLDELEKDVGNLSIHSSLQKENKKQKCSDGKVVSDKDAEETNVDKIPIKIKKVKQRKYGVLSKSESFPEDSDLAQELHCDAVKYIQDAAKQNNNQEASEFVLQQAVVTSSEESEENDETNKLNKNTEEEGDISDHSKIYITPMDDDDSQVTPKKNKSHKLLRLKSTDSEGDTDHEDKYSKDKSKKKCVRAKRKILSSDDETSSSESKEESDSSCSSLVFSDDKNTRKKKKISSDDDKEAKSSKKPKKRRRIKLLNTSESSSDVDNSKVVSTSKQSFQDTPSGKGRRNIRKLIIDHKLQDQTRVAAQEEMERRKRVLERQKLYNQVSEGDEKTRDAVTKKLILEIDPKTKKELVEVHPILTSKLKPHQSEGVKFMWECTVESLEQLKSGKGSGCILAHCMGLGKTLQVITFVHTLLNNQYTKDYFSKVLVVCPYNTILNWNREFNLWLEDDELHMNVYELASVRDNRTRANKLDEWQEDGGVIILGYDLFRLLVQEKSHGKRISKKLRGSFCSALLDPGPDIVICDEGHILKNNTSAIFKAMNRIRTRRRIVLTGTPLQNNLSEYHSMVTFVKESLLGTKKEFLNRFVNPIINGQCADSTPSDVKLMKRRVHILHKLLEGCVQRCDYSVIRKHLQSKYEYVISVCLSDTQIKLYQYFLDNMAQGKQTDGNKAASAQLFSDYSALRHIWTHPYILYLNKIRQANKMLYDSDESFIDDASTHSESDENIICLENPEPGTSSKMNDDDSSEKEVIKKWETRRQGREEIQDEDEEKDWWSDILPLEENKKIELSGKLVLFLEVLNRSEEIGDKVLLFSQSLLLLDMLEDILKMKSVENSAKSDQQTGYYGTWVPGVDYFRMDGCTNAENRKRWIDHFNDDEDSRCRLFLVSTKAGSLGTNLVGANRVIIIDTSWNPSHDTQAIFRVYRFGQKKPVYIYRFLAQGTMEEKIYDRQVTKLSLSCRVVDDQQIERHFNAADLEELYSFEPDSKSKRPTPMVPKDRLLADLLYQHANWIVSYHEHDSLLLNNPEEELTEEECQSAWQEYEAERKGIKNNLNFEFEATSSQEMPQKSNREKDSFNAQYNTNSEFQEVTQQIGNMVRMIKSKDLYQTPEQVHKNVMSSIYVTRNILQRQQVELLHKRQEFVTTQQPIPYDLAEKIQSTGRKIHAFNIYEHYWQNQTPVVRQNQQFQQVYQRKLSGFPNSSYQFLQKQQGYSNPNTQDHYPPSKVPNRNFPTFVHDPDVQWRFTQVGTARVPQAIFPSGVTITPVLSGSNSENIENIKSRPIITEVDDTENIPSQSCKTPSSVTIEEI